MVPRNICHAHLHGLMTDNELALRVEGLISKSPVLETGDQHDLHPRVLFLMAQSSHSGLCKRLASEGAPHKNYQMLSTTSTRMGILAVQMVVYSVQPSRLRPLSPALTLALFIPAHWSRMANAKDCSYYNRGNPG
jgi:hypothetical protein